MIKRESSNYSNNVEICDRKNGGKVVIKTPVLEQQDPFWYWCEKIFGLHVRNDPAEILTKSKKLNEKLDIILPQALDIEIIKDRVSFLYEYLDYNHVTEFDKHKAYQYGQFIGKIHQHKFDFCGNMYDYNISNEKFGKYLSDTIEKYFDSSYNTHKKLLEDIYYEIKPKLVNLKVKSTSINLLDVDADQYVYDENSNNKGIVDYEAMVVGPREIELVMWEFYLKEYFDEFVRGYKENCTYHVKDMEIYRFIVFLLDSLGSDLDFYQWFEKSDCFSKVNIEMNTGCSNKESIYIGSDTNKSNKQMDKITYETIINQLVEMKYEGSVILEFYNDKAIYNDLLQCIEFLKRMLPNTKKILYVNGSFLEEEFIIRLINGGIDVVSFDNVNLEKSSEVCNRLSDNTWKHIEMHNSSKLQEKSVTNKTNREFYSWEAVPCLISDELVLIDVYGNVFPCSEYCRKKYIMGNVLENNIDNIFHSAEYRKFRNYLRHGKRKKLSLCRYCENNSDIQK